MIIAAAVALVLGLVVVGGMALVSSFKAEAESPAAGTTPAPSAEAVRGQAGEEGQGQTVYATIEVIGESVKIFAAEPGNTEIHLDGLFNQGDIRRLTWKELDLTISNSSAVRMTVKGKEFPLPPKRSVSIRFIEGEPELVKD